MARPLIRKDGYAQECPDTVAIDGTAGDYVLAMRNAGAAALTLGTTDQVLDGVPYLWESSLLATGRQVYFEASGAGSNVVAGVTSALAVTASLYTVAGVQVAGSEVVISSLTAPKRVRSGAITLVNNTEYMVRYRTSGLAGTAYLFKASILKR